MMQMKSNIFFSVIIPTFNRGEGVRRALDSLVSQTYKDFEVLVCDDGSTDNTKEIVEGYKSDLNIQYIWNENSGSPARPRNIGITAAKGEWLSFLDSDDWWYPEKLATCLKYCNQADLIYHDMDIFTPQGKAFSKLKGRPLTGNRFQSLLLDRNAICNSSAVLRKTIAERAGPVSESRSLFAVEDYDYWLRISKLTDKLTYVPVSLGGYWVGTGNISVSENQIDRTLAVFEAHAGDLPVDLRSEARNRLQYRLGRMWQQFGNKEKALTCFHDGLKCRNKIYVLKTLVFGAFLIFTPRILWKSV